MQVQLHESHMLLDSIVITSGYLAEHLYRNILLHVHMYVHLHVVQHSCPTQ